MPIELILTGLSGVATVIWYLLTAKDKAQGVEISEIKEHIDTLYAKHEIDVLALQELRVMLASRHYEKAEVDSKFAEIKATISAGFADMGARFDKLSDALASHLAK